MEQIGSEKARIVSCQEVVAINDLFVRGLGISYDRYMQYYWSRTAILRKNFLSVFGFAYTAEEKYPYTFVLLSKWYARTL